MPEWMQALLWGTIAGGALLAGAAAGYLGNVPQRIIALVTAFGGGVLIAVLAFDLMEEAYERAGFEATAIGFLSGGLAFTVATWALSLMSGGEPEQAGDTQKSGGQHAGRGTTIAIGSLLDSVPESIVIGLSVLGGAVSWVTVIGITLSNIPEGMTGAAAMRQSGRPHRYVFGVWGVIALLTSVASLAGYSLFGGFSHDVTAAIAAVAAGAVLAMVATTMFPEAFAIAHNLTGLITVAGFLVAFGLDKLQQGP
ncbi:MAG: ZIP family metal transporter [Dehalococcoidia bacterium]